MPRPKSIRKIARIPTVAGFKPYGASNATRKTDAVFLLYEEYEALRLCDYEKYNQQNASFLMGISRPTFTRVYMSAREKIALAMVEGRKIIIEGGKVILDSEWMHCNVCGCYFSTFDDVEANSICALCGSTDIYTFKEKEPFSIAMEDNNNYCCGRAKCHGKRRRMGCKNENR